MSSHSPAAATARLPRPLIREFESRDVAPACALTNHFIERTVVHFSVTPHTDAQFAALWRSAVEPAPGVIRYPWLAAEVNGAFAGYAKAGQWRTREAYAPTAEVTVYVALDQHRKGVGRALYEALLDRLRRDGFHSAVGGITLPNPGSVGLHEAVGFRHVGTFRECGRKYDAWHDVGWWQAML